MSRAEVVVTFQVSLGSIKRWLRQRRTTGELDPQPPPGRTATIPADHYPVLIAQLTAHRDATLQEHYDLWQASQGVRVSRWTMSRVMDAAGWTRKKRP
jgi:transposase